MNSKYLKLFLIFFLVSAIEALDVNAPIDDAENTQLHKAVEQSNEVFVRNLLGCGANVMQENHYGLTPLQSACNNPNLLLLLIDMSPGCLGQAYSTTTLPLITCAQSGLEVFNRVLNFDTVKLDKNGFWYPTIVHAIIGRGFNPAVQYTPIIEEQQKPVFIQALWNKKSQQMKALVNRHFPRDSQDPVVRQDRQFLYKNRTISTTPLT